MSTLNGTMADWYSYTTTDSTASTITWTSPQYQQAIPYYYYQVQPPQPPKEDENTMNLYTVYLVYAEDRKAPVVKRVDGVIAKNEEDAKVKSGLMKEVDDSWDSDWLNFIVEEIGAVKVKPKPTEVKQV